MSFGLFADDAGFWLLTLLMLPLIQKSTMLLTMDGPNENGSKAASASAVGYRMLQFKRFVI